MLLDLERERPRGRDIVDPAFRHDVLAGLAMIGGGLLYLAGWPGYALAMSGAALAVTGIFGYCPACAMVGRKPVDRV